MALLRGIIVVNENFFKVIGIGADCGVMDQLDSMADSLLRTRSCKKLEVC